MLLTKELPHTVSIGGKEYAVHTNFKVWIGIFTAIKNGNDLEIFTSFANIFVEPYEVEANNMQEVANALMQFLLDAKTPLQNDAVTHQEEGGETKYFYDYDYDANYIYGAFWQQYGIDLHEVDLHFYKFIALFDCLDENTKFKKVVGYRTTDTKTIKDKEQKKHIEKMQRIFRLPLTAQEQKHCDDMEAELRRIWGEDDD